MHTLGRRLALIALATALCCLAGKAALADSKEESRKHFDNGTQMMELEDFSGATAEFKTSLSLYRTSSALFNLAMCQKAQHRYPEALDSFRALLSEFGGKLTEDTRKEVNENIALLSKIIAEVEIAVNVSGATVSIDGATVGTTPLPAPVRVGAGNRRISVSRPGYTTSEQQVQVVAGSKEVVRFDLQLESTGVAVATTAPGVTPAATGYTQDNPDPEMIAVENALGRPMYREYTRYQRGPASRKMGFVEYEYKIVKKKRNKGIILTCVLTPLFLGIGTTLHFVFRAKADEKRNQVVNDFYGDDTLNEEADALDGVSWVFFGLFAVAGTATLIPGAINWGVGASKMGKLEPAYKQYVEGVAPEPAAADPAAAPADAPPTDTPAAAPTARLELGLVPVFDHQGTPSGAGLAFVF